MIVSKWQLVGFIVILTCALIINGAAHYRTALQCPDYESRIQSLESIAHLPEGKR